MKKLSVLFLLTVVSTSSIAASAKTCPLHYRARGYDETALIGVNLNHSTHEIICEYFNFANGLQINNKYDDPAPGSVPAENQKYWIKVHSDYICIPYMDWDGRYRDFRDRQVQAYCKFIKI